MEFGESLKICRERALLTQKELVDALYVHDSELFASLHTGTLGKWERDLTHPTGAKMASLLSFFQKHFAQTLPCLDLYKIEEIEALFSLENMQYILGDSKELILNFPSGVVKKNEIKVYNVTRPEEINRFVEINMDLDKDLTDNFSQITLTQFKAWAAYPSNTLLGCEYKDEFFGLLFTLKLKPEIFEKIMKYEMMEHELRIGDFAKQEENGSEYVVSFFSMNKDAAALLFRRYFAYLATQKTIFDIGASVIMEDAKKLLSKMSLSVYSVKKLEDGVKLASYRDSLKNFFASEGMMNALFKRK